MLSMAKYGTCVIAEDFFRVKKILWSHQIDSDCTLTLSYQHFEYTKGIWNRR